MIKDSFSKIEYVDAFYISDNTLENVDLYPHTAYGKVVTLADAFVVLSFITTKQTTQSDNTESHKGVLLPVCSFLDRYRNINQSNFQSILIGNIIHVEWDDIVYFEKIVPMSQTKMYTEGEVVMKTDTFLVIKDPITIRVNPLPIKNHPPYTPFYYVIPLSFITKIEIQ